MLFKERKCLKLLTLQANVNLFRKGIKRVSVILCSEFEDVNLSCDDKKSLQERKKVEKALTRRTLKKLNLQKGFF